MRLLRLEEGDNVSLTDNLTHDIPPYAILSHTWGARGEEVIFQDIQNNDFQQKPGYGKILFCGRQAQLDGLDYFWVDTCCIDKTSSAELAESINSMYRWYENAQKCYVYLSDMTVNLDRNTPPLLSSWLHGFRNTRWFTRGWTLQELLAPPVVEFFSSNGQKLGDKTSLEEPIHNITNVPILSLRGFSQSNVELDTIFSWCQNRETTRPEDKVYSLLGLAGVSLPVIYGEGEGAAFLRLCGEVLQHNPTKGQSLLIFVTQIGHTPALRVLIRGRESIESKNEDGYSLLALAASKGHETAIRMLLDEGANIESKTNRGTSPLGVAAWHGCEAAIRTLLDKGANIESKNDAGNSPLGIAAINGHEAAIRILLDKGANIESKNDAGNSPLGIAAINGHEAAIRTLLDKGANIQLRNIKGKTLLEQSVLNGREVVFRLLLDEGAPIVTTAIFDASQKFCRRQVYDELKKRDSRSRAEKASESHTKKLFGFHIGKSNG
ncbi:ankyrin repeat-containing domain protein [Pestalotiopsis sp. NC0098]|nr:ankyrin repeat-containing domain protein [Pestalotiopsis sp. NC0098]